MATRLKTKTVAHAPNLGEEAHRRRVLLNAALEWVAAFRAAR
jgi:hypothetical protein